MPIKPEILFVDDSRTARAAAKKILSEQYIVDEAKDGKDAWEKLEKNPDYAVVFADIQMPELNGLQLLKHIRTSPDRRIAQKPIIMITGHSDTHAAMRAVFERGATGFISKPFSDIDLISCACSYISLNQRLNQLEDTLGIDRQSGLYNASRFEAEGCKTLSMALRHKLELSVVYLELKSLSDISDNHSNKAATQVVVEVGKRIKKHLRDEEIVARIGTSRFALLLPATSSPNSKIAITRVQSMIKKMSFVINKHKIQVSIAAGISSIDHEEKDLGFSKLCLRAESALQNSIDGDTGDISSYHDDSDTEVDTGTDKKVQYDYFLNKSLPYIIDGNFSKIPDDHLDHVMGILKPFIRYASLKNSSS
ncbi:MAG: response regulator [Gammaproteobacteria bacterium]|nr:response regulator [Gammaproteobacteria bacterium]